VTFTFKGRRGQVALDQIRTVNKNRLVKKLGKADNSTALSVAAILTEMFAIS